MKLFLWDQSMTLVESRGLLQRAVLQYETSRRNKDYDGESGADSLFVVAKTPRGKPFAVRPSGSPLFLQMSVTHTDRWWLCAVGERNVGIDVELKSRDIRASIARRICTPQEELWLKTWESDREMLRSKLLWLWVRKEAYVKYVGTGLSQGLTTFSTLEGGKEKQGFVTVNLGCVSEKAQRELEIAVYSPWEDIEGIEWIEWK